MVFILCFSIIYSSRYFKVNEWSDSNMKKIIVNEYGLVDVL